MLYIFIIEVNDHETRGILQKLQIILTRITEVPKILYSHRFDVLTEICKFIPGGPPTNDFSRNAGLKKM